MTEDEADAGCDIGMRTEVLVDTGFGVGAGTGGGSCAGAGASAGIRACIDVGFGSAV